MGKKGEIVLSELLLKDAVPRLVEPHIYSVLDHREFSNSYDSNFGNFYDWMGCNPLYNRLIWGYSVKKFSSLTGNALTSSESGAVLDLGCGSLAFTAKTYIGYSARPVILVDQSLKLLRMAKARLIKFNSRLPENMVFLHADALHLPFKADSFNAVISLNLLHCIPDVKTLLTGLKKIAAKNCHIGFTTLVKGNRLSDKYLDMWEHAGELVSRTTDQLLAVFNEVDMPVKFRLNGNMAFFVITL